jgi:hypothetical protein
MKKCLDLSIFGYSATNHTPNQTPYSSIPDNELFMLSCKWLSFNVNCADKIEYEIPQNITKCNHSERLINNKGLKRWMSQTYSLSLLYKKLNPIA